MNNDTIVSGTIALIGGITLGMATGSLWFGVFGFILIGCFV